MQQRDLASATPIASREGDNACSETPKGSGLMEAVAASRETSALAALLPDFTLVQHLPRGNDGSRFSGIAAWSLSPNRARAGRRAIALGIPCVLLGPGLLRAPHMWGDAVQMLSATADVITGPSSPADRLNS